MNRLMLVNLLTILGYNSLFNSLGKFFVLKVVRCSQEHIEPQLCESETAFQIFLKFTVYTRKQPSALLLNELCQEK